MAGLAGHGSQDHGPARGGSPAAGSEGLDSHRPDRGTPHRPDDDSHHRTAAGGVLGFLLRFDNAFSRTFRAMAMAEDGTRELALEQLEGGEAGRETATEDAASRSSSGGGGSPDPYG